MNVRELADKLWPFLARLFCDSGSFTPTIVGAGTPGTFTYDSTNTKIEYTRIFDFVFFRGRARITATSVAPTGNVTLNGFPLTSGAGTNNGNVLGGAVVMAATAINLVAGYTQLGGYFGNAATSMFLVETGDNVNLAVVQGGELGTTVDIYVWGIYGV